MRLIHIGIDASNIRSGGGLTHLSQLLKAVNPDLAGISRMTVWTNHATEKHLPDRSWLEIQCLPWAERPGLSCIINHMIRFPKVVKQSGCDVIFSPGGAWLPRKEKPMITMSQNMLPFESLEALRFGQFSLMRLKMRILRSTQRNVFKGSDGIIFLTEFAREQIIKKIGGVACPTALVPHGVEQRFFLSPRSQRCPTDFSDNHPFRILYVSILMPYKHQLEVAHAVAILRRKGVPIELTFIGTSWGRYGVQFKQLITKLDPQQTFLKWLGHVGFDDLHHLYQQVDASIFASSCENMPNIVMEAMAAGLPIASSNRGPMPDILGTAAIYFDPDSVESIQAALNTLYQDTVLRKKISNEAWEKAQVYSWVRCANETFAFIARIAHFQIQKMSNAL